MSCKTTFSIIVTIALVYALYIVGLQLFLSGFLLKRIVITQNSSSLLKYQIDCNDIESVRSIANSLSVEHATRASNFRQFDRAVIIIIDALRFDFVSHSSVNEEFYLNKMPVFHQALKRHRNQAILFQLKADPPTTTLQRLKGLTTGSLPTFIDVSLNFASSEIPEDNLIRQMNYSNKQIVFMGDDTWESIFPNKFHRSYPYPSFNVKDLDTVDDGVLLHLSEEMAKNDSDVIIAHFLGVDHCGHHYGPRHPEMARKLRQMNDVIQSVMENMSNDTILLVLGDHGMTASGDHGGDSAEEISTALFFYSPTVLTHHATDEIAIAAQVDVVPTLSFLLGLPIPFSNLGSTITPLMALNFNRSCYGKEIDSALASALALAENALQVQRYLQAYSKVSQQLSPSFISQAEMDLEDLFQSWQKIPVHTKEIPNFLLNISEGYKRYLGNIRNVCAEKWATFDISFIVMGCVVLCFAVICNFWATAQTNNNQHLILLCSVLVIMLTLLCMQELFNFYYFFAVGGAFSCFVFLTYKWMIDIFYYRNSFIVFFCVIFIVLFVSLSNSFNLFNFVAWFLAFAVPYLFVSLTKRFILDVLISVKDSLNFSVIVLFILFVTSFSNSFVVFEDRTIMYVLQSAILYRFFPLCLDSLRCYISFHSNKAKGTKRSTKSTVRLLLPLICLICLITCVRMGTAFYKCREEQAPCSDSDIIVSLEKLHQSQSYKVARLLLSLAAKVVPVVIFLGIISYKYSLKMLTVSAVCVKYGTFFVCVLICLRWWLNVVPLNVVDRILKGNEVVLTRASSFTCISLCIIILFFPILAERPWEFESKEIYYGSFMSFTFVVLQLLYLVSGDALSPAIMLMSFSAVLSIILINFSSNISESQIWADVILWCLLSRHWFYATAHQTAFTSIQWDAAFLLNHKEVYSYALSGALVFINTFASLIFHAVTLPAIFIPRESVVFTSQSIQRLHMKYLLCFGVKLLGTVCASFILRRHLMVWKIFSPKLLYEVLMMAITMLSVSLGHYFMVTVVSQYHKLLRLNLNQMFAPKDE